MTQNQYKPSSCTGCGECAFCPVGIDLEKVVVLTDRALRGDESAKAEYAALALTAGKCIGCGRFIHLTESLSRALCEAVADEGHFALDEERTLLFGHCESCAGGDAV